ncbi:MAG: hypothetical protein Q7W29_08995 [bacterium]|nr:hypothetical protein [bacterium]
MELKPQDLYVVLKLVTRSARPWTYSRLSAELHMSASETNAAVKRSLRAGLLRVPVLQERNPQPVRKCIDEFLCHGLKYVFVPEQGGMVRGMPTAFAAPGLDLALSQDGQPPYVWPWEEGTVRGLALSPLHPNAPKAAHEDIDFHRILALVDCLRTASPRGAGVATMMLEMTLFPDAGR